jgi:hypothetical protein
VQEMLETNSVPEAHAGGKEPHNIRHEDESDGAWEDHARLPGMNDDSDILC